MPPDSYGYARQTAYHCHLLPINSLNCSFGAMQLIGHDAETLDLEAAQNDAATQVTWQKSEKKIFKDL